MRHRKRRNKLSMMTAHRNAMLRNMAKNLLKFQRVETTVARAKEARRLVEHLITLSKTDTVASRRRAYDILTDRDLVYKLFKETSQLFKSRSSGYTRIIPLGFRRGDGASLCVFELTEKKIVEKLPKKKKEKSQKTEGVKPEAGSKPAKEEHKKEPHVPPEPRIKTIQKKRPTLEEEKRTEKAKSEDKKASQQRGFMKNLRGLFRKRGDF
ncbi:MAG: 50S ribosomal protein L17 [Candidatus Omnitrophica bacterium]|nr:50S ribosomal protein L17 [Candidatus Omnitrophota bacterium]